MESEKIITEELAQEVDHSNPVKTPKQFLWTAIFAFVIPVFIIIGLVNYVTTGKLPINNTEEAIAQRLAKVGTVVMKGATTSIRSGQAVYESQCIACHANGLLGSPVFGDASAWTPRFSQGYNALLTAVLQGKNAMPAQGGGVASDLEIARATVYLLNAAGGDFPEPDPETFTGDNITQ